MKILFIDKNESLVKKVKKAIKHLPFEVSAKQGDIFSKKGVIVSASNPSFSMGGGLDAAIAERYPRECEIARKTPGEMRQVGPVMFTITVGDDLKATRDTVGSALKFALDTKNHSSYEQTMLVSGLGTGIGGLDEDDFVWLFLVAVTEAFGYRWGIKFTKKNGKSWYKDASEITFKVGEWTEQSDAKKDGKKCGVGLHVGKSFVGAGNYCIPEKIFFQIFEKSAVCGEGYDKIRVSRLLTVAELPNWLGYGPNGKQIISKIGEKFDPEKYNPYQATELPSAEAIKSMMKNFSQVMGKWGQFSSIVRNKLMDQVGEKVMEQVMEQVRPQVGDQVWNQIWNQVRDQFWNQIWNQAWNHVWDQVRYQVEDTTYFAINTHFNIGISHWFGDFLSLEVMLIFVDGKIKVFGKEGKYLGEYAND